MHAGPRGERATRPTNDHDIGDACSWGRPHKHIDRTALRLPQSSARRRPSAMAPICRQFRRATPSWVLLCAELITHQNYITHFNSTVNSPMGPGLINAMEPGSHPSWHTNRTPGGLAAPCSPSWRAMVGPGCERKITRTPLLRHRCLVSNLHRVRAVQYTRIRHSPMGPFSPASLTLLSLLRVQQSTYCRPSSDWDSTALDVDLRV